MEFRGILKVSSFNFKLRHLDIQLLRKCKKIHSWCLHVKIYKLGLLMAAMFFLLQHYLSRPVQNIYFKKNWNDGKTLKEASTNTILRPWYETTNNKNIFFHETSLVENGVISLDARQACSIESAALTNPNHNIFVFFTSQVGFRNTTKLPFIDALLSYPNVHINYLNITKYAENTPLEDWIKTDKLFRSQYVISHTSDVLRFLSMFKYGGTYLDLDVVMLKPLDSQGSHNFAAAESDDVVNVAILHLEGKSGHEIAEKCIRDLKENFSQNDWGNNGPWVLTRILHEICGTKDIKKMVNEDICQNFKVLPVDMCFNIGWLEVEKLFEEEHSKEVMRRISDKLMVHVWNKLSASISLTKHDNVAYIQIAKKYCPKILDSSNKF